MGGGGAGEGGEGEVGIKRGMSVGGELMENELALGLGKAVEGGGVSRGGESERDALGDLELLRQEKGGGDDT